MPPFSVNPRNVTRKWSGTDNEQSFNQNPNKSEWENVDISYVYNSNGFRCPEFDSFKNQRVNLALGCSFTEGIGLPVEMTWPFLLSKQINEPVINLGIGGGNSDQVARVLTNVSGLFTIGTVYILWPPLHRFEFYQNDGRIFSRVPGTTDELEYLWVMDDAMSYQRLYKNKLIASLLASKYNFNLIESDVVLKGPTYGIDFHPGVARDGQHFGVRWQEYVVENFLRK